MNFRGHGAKLLCSDHVRSSVPSQEEHPAPRPEDPEHFHGKERNAEAGRLRNIQNPQPRERFRHHRDWHPSIPFTRDMPATEVRLQVRHMEPGLCPIRNVRPQASLFFGHIKPILSDFD